MASPCFYSLCFIFILLCTIYIIADISDSGFVKIKGKNLSIGWINLGNNIYYL